MSRKKPSSPKSVPKTAQETASAPTPAAEGPAPATPPAGRKRLHWIVAAVVVVALGAAALLGMDGMRSRFLGQGAATSKAPAADAHYVGGAVCAECHAKEQAAWRGSDHDLAMQVADEKAVLGDFANARFKYAGTTTTFSRRDGKYVVTTDGPDGKLHDYEIKYAFGVHPLQQYLIEMPGGRMQALSIAWDSRPKGQGGQRWFHLYPGQNIKAGDWLHWTSAGQNWNFTCAECHSTNLRKNFDAATGTYKTTWSEPCHAACSFAWHSAHTVPPTWRAATAVGFAAAAPGPSTRERSPSMPNSAAAPSATTATAATTQRSGLPLAAGITVEGASAAVAGAGTVSGADFGTGLGVAGFFRDIVRCG